MDLVLRTPQRTRVMRTHVHGASLRVEGEDQEPIEASILARDRSTLLLDLGGRRHRVRYFREGRVLHLQLHGFALRVELGDDEDEGDIAVGAADPVIKAPMPGKVLEILVEEGQEVQRGQGLVRVEAMKMEVDLEAPFDATVASISAREGRIVDPDEALMVLEARDEE